MKNILPILLFTCSLSFLNAQIKSSKLENEKLKKFPKENIHLHVNKDLIVTGEKIEFSLFLLNEKINTPSNLSKIAYVELINSKKESIKKIKLKLNNSLGYGNIFIPNSLNSGSYKVIAYTRWMLNFNTFFQKDIMIYNPFKNDFKNAKNFSEENQQNKVDLYIENSKPTRSLTSISLNNLISEKGNYSINISKVTPKVNKNLPLKNNIQVSLSNKQIYLPEIRGEIISGTLISSNKIDFSKTKVSYSVIGKNGFSLVTNANKNGHFIFIIDKLYLNKKAYIQVLNDSSPVIIKINDNYSPNLDKLIFKSFVINKKIGDYIEKQTIYNQIQNAYKKIKEDSIINSSLVKKPSNFFKKFKLDEYTRFNSMKETFKEIIIGAWIKENKDKVTFHVQDDKYSAASFLKSLVIIDGFLINDHKDLLALKTSEINTITLYKELYKLNGAMYDGIIIFETFDHNYKPKENNLIFQYLSKNQIYSNTNSKDYTKKDSRIPDFSTCLLFKNNLHGNEKIDFYTSDIIGNYQLEIEGFTNFGKLIQIKKFFSVK